MILVTGSEGFIAKELINNLKDQKIIDLDIKTGHDLSKVNALDEYNNIDIIYHFASANKNYFYENADRYYINNRKINNNIIKLAKRTNAFVVFASSTDIYGDSRNAKETNEFKIPNNLKGLYILDKILMENDLRINNIKHCNARISNVFGKNQGIDNSIISLLSYQINHEIKSEFTNSTQSFIDIRDCIQALIKIGSEKIEGDINISNESLSIESLYKILCLHFGKAENYSAKKSKSIRIINNDKLKKFYSVKYSLKEFIDGI